MEDPHRYCEILRNIIAEKNEEITSKTIKIAQLEDVIGEFRGKIHDLQKKLHDKSIRFIRSEIRSRNMSERRIRMLEEALNNEDHDHLPQYVENLFKFYNTIIQPLTQDLVEDIVACH